MKYDERTCKFNMDTGCVELLPTLTPSNLTEGTITAQDPLPGTLLHRNAHVRLVAK